MADAPLTSSELGNLWQAYQEKSMVLRVMEYFIEKSNEPETKKILQTIYEVDSKNEKAIKTVFDDAGAAIPTAFTENDVHIDVPRLFDDSLMLMVSSLMGRVLGDLYCLHSGASYRSDICDLYINFTSDSQHLYKQITQCLLDKGVLTRPPLVPMPTEVEFVESKDYTSGLNPFKKSRALNTVEIGLLYQSLEANNAGKQMMAGFAQVAEDPDVKKYLQRGKELAKNNVATMSNLLLESDLQAPTSSGGMVTDSTTPPFSDKMMMYITNLLSMFGLGSNAVGAAFSFRSDLLLKMGQIMTKTFDFAKDGGEILIKKGWMEEPPQAVNRDQLAKDKG